MWEEIIFLKAGPCDWKGQSTLSPVNYLWHKHFSMAMSILAYYDLDHIWDLCLGGGQKEDV